jgi:hypothetical protein
MRRGFGRLYDALVSVGKAVMTAARLGRRGGESTLARLQGPYGTGTYGAPLLSKVEQVLHFRGWTYRCIDYLCSRIAQTPPAAVLAADPTERAEHELQAKAFRLRGGDPPPPRTWVSPLWRQKSQGPARPNEEYEFLPDSHPLCRLLQDPNDPETGVSVWYEWALFAFLTGESYLWMVEDDAGRVSELWVIPSHWVRPVCEGREHLVDYFEVAPRGTSGGVVRFDPEELIWYRRPSPLSKLFAASPVQAAAHLVDAYEKTEAARNFSLDNGAAVGGVIQVPPETQLDDAAIARLESRFYAKYQGVYNFNRPLILEGGATWIPAPPERELAYMQSQDQIRRYVMAHWGLDEVVLGFSSVANRAAMVAAILNVNETAINPRRKEKAAILTEKLARRFDERARIFWPDDSPLDPDARRADFELGVRAGAVAVNELRTHILGLEPYPEEEYDRPAPTAPPGKPPGPGSAPDRGEPALPRADDGTSPATQAQGLAEDTDRSPDREIKRFDPNEPRDERGRWTDSPGGGQPDKPQAATRPDPSAGERGKREPAFVRASPAEYRKARAQVRAKIRKALVPSAKKVKRHRAILAAIARDWARRTAMRKAGKTKEEILAKLGPPPRPGGDTRGSSKARKSRAKRLFEEFGGNERGYVICHGTGIKLHWTTNPKENPHGYPKFEQGKIFVFAQGGSYTMDNLLPESRVYNRWRGAKPLRKENL